MGSFRFLRGPSLSLILSFAIIKQKSSLRVCVLFFGVLPFNLLKSLALYWQLVCVLYSGV